MSRDILASQGPTSTGTVVSLVASTAGPLVILESSLVRTSTGRAASRPTRELRPC